MKSCRARARGSLLRRLQATTIASKVEALRGYALRPPTDWRCRIKSRSEEKRFLDLVRFCFARYRVPAHLEQVWIADVVDDDFVDKITAARSP